MIKRGGPIIKISPSRGGDFIGSTLYDSFIDFIRTLVLFLVFIVNVKNIYKLKIVLSSFIS